MECHPYMNSFLFATQFIPVEALSLLAALEDADLMACNAVLSALARSGQCKELVKC